MTMRMCVTLVLVCCLGACAGLRGNYARPQAQMPAGWMSPSLDTARGNATDGRWWQRFDDPVLSGLVEQALQRNADVAVAAYKLRTARLQAGQAVSDSLPDVSVSADSASNRDLKTNIISRSSSASGSVSYELDLWGKMAAARDAADWEAKASEDDLAEARLTVVGTVMKTYWQIGYLQERLRQTQDRIDAARQLLELVTVKYDAGAVSGLDVIQARQELASRQSELPALAQELADARTTMSLLFDQAPEQVVAEVSSLPDRPVPDVAPGVPARLLARRPDLRAAEWRLRSTLASVDQARADLYPTLTLTGSLGSSSSQLRDVLDNPVATLGAGLALPFVQWNAVHLAVDVARNEYEQAVVAFRQSLYAALGDVENALSARTRYAEETPLLRTTLDLAEQSERITAAQYQAGAAPLQDWIDARDTRRTVELSLLENRLNMLQARVDLYLALGGDDDFK